MSILVSNKDSFFQGQVASIFKFIEIIGIKLNKKDYSRLVNLRISLAGIRLKGKIKKTHGETNGDPNAEIYENEIDYFMSFISNHIATLKMPRDF